MRFGISIEMPGMYVSSSSAMSSAMINGTHSLIMNNNIYQRYTGKNNENVLSNLRYLIGKDKAKQIVIRTPLIPSYNTEKDIDQSIELLKEMGITQFDRFTYKTPND